ncbi:hypothetical protein TWF694_005089 [Orbilia ellipsospora]|uniref:Cyanovirin-N domain-containing protein n=1 Tax=Orbilia ellipsospora TaxID=2528407 RepID=A0AAV9WUJ5_9PEZI
MVRLTTFSISIAIVLSFLGDTTAAPAPAPEVDYVSLIKTGAGLPTVRELGLTNADLTKPLPRHSKPALNNRDSLEKRYTPKCWDGPRCNRTDILVCYNYFSSLEFHPCIAGRNAPACSMGGCGWWFNTDDGLPIAVDCHDVALSGAWVLNNCQGNLTSGSNAAQSDDRFIINIHT